MTGSASNKTRWAHRVREQGGASGPLGLSGVGSSGSRMPEPAVSLIDQMDNILRMIFILSRVAVIFVVGRHAARTANARFVVCPMILLSSVVVIPLRGLLFSNVWQALCFF